MLQYSSYTNNRWKGILSIRSLNDFEEKVVLTVVNIKFICQKVYMRFFFFVHALIDRCQIVTDICKKMFQVVCKRFSRFLASYHEHRLHWFTLNSSIYT